MKQTIQIQTVDNKVSKANKIYARVNNKYTVFEDNLIQRLRQAIGSSLVVEIAESNGYFNIRQIYDESPGIVVNENVITHERFDTKGPVEVAKAVVKESELVLIRDKPNSRTLGKGQDQIKLYFKDAKDLEEQIEELYTKNLMPLDWLRERNENLAEIERE